MIPLVFLAALPALARAQEPALFLPPGEIGAREHAWEQVQRRDDLSITGVQYVRINVDAMQRMRQRGASHAVSAVLFGRQYVLDIRRIRPMFRHLAYEGSVRGHDGSVGLAMGRQGATGGFIEFESERYQVAYTGVRDIHAVLRVDRGLMDTYHGKCAAQTPADQGPALATAPSRYLGPMQATATSTTIDVMVFYSPAARQAAGGTVAMEAEIAGAMTMANGAATGSGVQHTLRLVYTGETNYTESLNSGLDLSRFQGTNDGYMDEVHALRNAYGGDLMALLLQNVESGICGRGYIMTNVSSGFRTQAFSVSRRSCISNRTMTHEMGHNMGSAHDRANAGAAAYSYSYGARTSNSQYRSIMAYSPGTRVNRWSGPGTTWAGMQLGSATEDNVRSLTNTAPTVANFKAVQTFEFTTLPGGIAGATGKPTINGRGTASLAVPIRILVGNTVNGAPGVFVAGLATSNLPLFGGTLVPRLDISTPITGTAGTLSINLNVLSTLSPGVSAYFQAFYLDMSAAQSFSATDGLQCVLP